VLNEFSCLLHRPVGYPSLKESHSASRRAFSLHDFNTTPALLSYNFYIYSIEQPPVFGNSQNSFASHRRIDMTASKPLVLYDISSPLQPCSYAPNPSKARLTLSFKRVTFKTTWVDIVDINDVRKGLNCPATRKLDDGSDFYTLPILQDPNSNRVIGDSFDIANYLEETFPNPNHSLFPANSTRTGLDYESPSKDTMFFAPLTTNVGSKDEDYAQFNLHVDATFSVYMILYAQYLPFNPETADAAKALFVKRAHLKSWDDMSVQGEAREQLKTAFEKGLTSLAEPFMVHGSGPYLEGEQANYADLIVGGWVNMLSILMPEDEWKEFRTWHGGVFARLHDALQENCWVCT
jgi:glutathione S-transferase